MPDIQLLLKRHEKLKSDRSTLDSHCQEIAEKILPYRADFTVTRTMGEKRTEKIFDSTASLALTRFVAAYTSMLVPEGQTWHQLRSSNPDLNKLLRVQRYFQQTTDILFRYRYAGGFGSQIQEVFSNHGTFGTAALMIEPAKNGGIYYKAIPLSKFWIAENDEGRIDVLHREYKFTAHQACNYFGSLCPKIITDCMEHEPQKMFDFVQIICPNDMYSYGRADWQGMPYMSIDICMQDKEKPVKIGGYRTFPAPVSRFMTICGEPYGYSPAMTILADVNVLNEIEKTNLKIAHQTADPAWLISDDLMGSKLQFKPGALNYGGLDSNGNPMMAQMVTKGNLTYSLEMADQKRKVINDAFFVSLFQILVESHTMSATEVIERAREKAALLAPSFSRQQTELLHWTIIRELDILAHQGRLPEMPPELVEARGEYQIVYDSPLARAQRSEATVGFARTMEMVMPIAQQDPSVLAMFDFQKATRGIADINGMNLDWMRDEKEVAALQEQQAQQQQDAQLLQAAPLLAEAGLKQEQARQIALNGNIGRT